MAIRRDTEQLIAAYVDGVSELSADERARVEALVERDAGARTERDETRAIVSQLRALPDPHGEPDWGALAQRIEHAVGPDAPRPWWRSWRWLVPTGALAAASVAALLFVHRVPAESVVAVGHDGGATPEHAIAVPHDPSAHDPEHDVATGNPSVLFLDGETMEVDDADAARLLDDLIDDRAEPVDPIADDDLLPSTDLSWIDNLDDASIERVEHWLADHGPKKKG